MTNPETPDDIEEPVELVSEAERERNAIACFTTLISSLKDWEEEQGKVGRKR